MSAPRSGGVIGIRAAVLFVLIVATGCLPPTITDSGTFGAFSRLDASSQQQRAVGTTDRDALFEILVYGLVSDRTELVEAALIGGANPNGTIDWTFIRQAEMVGAEEQFKGSATDEVWRDGGPLYTYSFILGSWCDDAEKVGGRCVLKGPWSVSSAPSSLFPVVALVQSPEALDLMLRFGAEFDQELLDGTLHAAAQFGRLPLVERLASMGGQIDSMGVDGLLPMHRAAQFARADVVRWLLAQGLDPNTGGPAVEPVSAPGGGRIYIGPGIGQSGVTPLHILGFNGSRGTTFEKNEIPLIGGVVPGGPAGRAGLQAGDLVIAVNDQPIQTFNQLVAIVQASPGIELRVRIERAGQLYETVLVPDTLISNGYGGVSGAVGASGGLAIGQAAGQRTGRMWVQQERWRPDWRDVYSYNPGYREALESLIAAGAYLDARANARVIPGWWEGAGNLAAFDQTPLHVAYETYSYDIVEGLVEAGADEKAQLATGETPKDAATKVQVARSTAEWREMEAQRIAATRQQQQAAESDAANAFGQLMALGGVAAVTAYGAGQGIGAEALTMGAGMAADIMTDGEAGGIQSATSALNEYAASQQQVTSPGLQPVTEAAPQSQLSGAPAIPAQLAQACENTLSIGSVEHSFLQISLPSGARVPVQASVYPAEGGRAVRLESTSPVGNATRIVAQILIPDSARQPGNILVSDDNTIPGLESGAVGTLDVFRGREYANFRTNFDFGRNRSMGSVQLLDAGARLRGTFSFDAVEDGYPRRGEQYRADVAGSFCAQ